MKSKTQNDGFTLIEILIVISILTIIAAITFPNLSNIIARMEARKVESILQTITTHSKQQAYIHHRRIAFCGSADGLTCNNSHWSNYIILFNDSIIRNRIKEPNEELLEVIHLNLKHGQLTWSGAGRQNPAFQPDSGLPRGANGTFRYCSHTHNHHIALILSDMGHLRANRQLTC